MRLLFRGRFVSNWFILKCGFAKRLLTGLTYRSRLLILFSLVIGGWILGDGWYFIPHSRLRSAVLYLVWYDWNLFKSLTILRPHFPTEVGVECSTNKLLLLLYFLFSLNLFFLSPLFICPSHIILRVQFIIIQSMLKVFE